VPVISTDDPFDVAAWGTRAADQPSQPEMTRSRLVREGMKGGHFSEVLQHCNTRSLAMEIRDCPLREIVRLRHTTVKHHLDDLRTLFIFASKNRGFWEHNRRRDPVKPQKQAE